MFHWIPTKNIRKITTQTLRNRSQQDHLISLFAMDVNPGDRKRSHQFDFKPLEIRNESNSSNIFEIPAESGPVKSTGYRDRAGCCHASGGCWHSRSHR